MCGADGSLPHVIHSLPYVIDVSMFSQANFFKGFSLPFGCYPRMCNLFWIVHFLPLVYRRVFVDTAAVPGLSKMVSLHTLLRQTKGTAVLWREMRNRWVESLSKVSYSDICTHRSGGNMLLLKQHPLGSQSEWHGSKRSLQLITELLGWSPQVQCGHVIMMLTHDTL